MKLLRIGAILLTIGMTLLVATNLRAASQMTSTGKPIGLFGPYLLEPRETTIVLKDVTPQNVTVAVVSAQIWHATQNISEFEHVFTVSGMNKLDSITFNLNMRGLYYIVVFTTDGRLAEEVRLVVVQEGLPKDLLWISGILSSMGVIMIVIHQLRPLARRR